MAPAEPGRAGAARAAFVPPREFDEYRLVRPLGQGTFGQVYLAHDTVLDRPVAIKFLPAAHPGSLARERFLVEARAIARLHHPHVVAVYRAGEVAGRPYLVSELLRGRSLDRLEKPLPWRRALALGLGLARGLGAAHRHGVLHRDIKPANAMLLDSGEVKLLDFGLAKLLGARPAEEGSAAAPAAGAGLDETAPLDLTHEPTGETPSPAAPAALTGAGALVGTPLYIAPEVWRGEPATARSDIYALGALLFELCAGHPPHREATLEELREAALTREPPDLAAVAPETDGRLCAVVRRCLERDPAARFASGEELARALAEIAEEDSAAARGGADDALPGGNPYRGLHAFEAEHRPLFFGRDAEVRAVLELLRSAPLLLLAGDSGVGKSSLCRAGVLPRVAEGALGGGRRWLTAALLPGRRPLAALAEALPRSLGPPAEWLALLRERPASDVARVLRQRLGDEGGLLLFIDQLEELTTQADPEEAALFGEVAGQLCARLPGVRLLATARADALTRLAAVPGLGPELAHAVRVLRPMSPEELREAVVGPARARGVAFESEALVEELVRSTAEAEGALPLLQFALAELWEARDRARRLIPASALQAIGGVAGALARHADAVLRSLLPAARAAARRVLTKLVTMRGARVRRPAAELLGADPADAVALESLVRGRLLVAREAEGGPAYELAHEALVSGWATLRRWLDEDQDRRAVRERLAAASAEWERVGRARDSLWGARQLAEVKGIDERELPPREVAFLQAARQQLRRRRWTRRGLVLGVPLAVALSYGGSLLQAQLRAERELRERLRQADEALGRGRIQAGVAAKAQQEAFARFDRAESDAAEQAWARARALAEEAQRTYAQASAALEAGLVLGRRGAELRERLAEVLFERALLAERGQQRAQRDQLLDWLARYDPDGRWRARWQAPARLVLRALPPGTGVAIERYEDGGARRLSLKARLRGPSAEAPALAPGSYRLTIAAPARAVVRYPLLLRRGEVRELALTLPPGEAVPAGFVYVPPGPFLSGAAVEEDLRRDLFKVPPLHEVTTGAYLIARTEVTFGDWLAFLRALPPAERAARTPTASARGAVTLRQLPDGAFELALQPTTQPYRAREGEKIRYPGRTRRAEQDWLRMPVSGISWEDAQAYVAWLRSSGRLPRARLCTELEWERAARGADGRLYPHGELMAADDANHDRTYGRHPLGFGPDEVGSHPASDSPFGVADLAGNVWEWARGPAGALVLRGGSWYQEALVACTFNREAAEPTLRRLVVGLRLCADP